MAWPLIAMAAASAAKAGANAIGGKKAQKAEDQRRADAQAKMDAYTQKYGDFQGMLARAFGIDPTTMAATGTTGIAAQMLAPQVTTTEQSTNMLTRPEIAKEYQGGENLAYSKLLQNVQRGSSLPPGYATTQAQSIRAAVAPAVTAEGNVAARHGLSREQALIGSTATRDANAQINQMKANLPLQERQMASENLGWLTQYLQGLRGTRQKGTSNSKTTGPADYGDYLGLMGALAPKEPTVVT